MAKPQRKGTRRQPPKRPKPKTWAESPEPKRGSKIVTFLASALGVLVSALTIAAWWPDVHIDIPDSSFNPSYVNPAGFSISNNAYFDAHSASAMIIVSAEGITAPMRRGYGHFHIGDNAMGPFHVADTLKKGAPMPITMGSLEAPFVTASTITVVVRFETPIRSWSFSCSTFEKRLDDFQRPLWTRTETKGTCRYLWRTHESQ